MPLLLAPGLSFCDADGGRIFLDVSRDRYFCLGAEADAAFSALANGDRPTDDQCARLVSLVAAGVLIEAETGAPPRACHSVPIVAAPLNEDRPTQTSRARILAAACAIQGAKFQLRWSGLAMVFRRLQRRKTLLLAQLREATPHELAEVTTLFAATSRIVSSFDQCLPLSCAILSHCLAARISADLVLGVKLRPFQAHAWVVASDTLLSDRIATVRQFTPIWVL